MAEIIRAGIYCRLSLARMGDTTNVDDQERRCRQLCEQRGWEVAEVYADNSRSAWQPNRKRPGWDKMLADIDAGRLDAIVVYHGDRLMRRPEDLGTLLGVARIKGIKLASLIGDRDLSNPDDEYILWIEAAGFGRASADTSRRMKRDIERRRRAGIANSGGRGGRPFGFATDGITHIPAETAIVREVTARALAGESVRHVATDLAARGITTTAGKPMHPLAVRRMLALPRYAGLMPDGVSAAAWEPVVSREDWETAQALVSGRASPLAPGHNARRYLLSGIARCGACGGPMQVLPSYTSRMGKVIAARYGCLAPGCRKVFRNLERLDLYVTVRTAARLSDPHNPPGRIPSAPGLAAELRALAEERTAIEAAITDHTKGRLHLLLGRLDSVDARLTQLRELAGDNARSRLLHSHAGISRQEFDGLPLATRRALVSACFTITILPSSKRGPGFRTEDVRLAPAPGM